MKLLLIAESFPLSTKGEFTGGVEKGDYFVARELAQKHQVTVLTSGRTGAASREILENMSIIRVGTKVSAENREAPFVRLAFMVAAVKHSIRLDFDLIIGSNVFSQLVTILVALITRKPAVAKVADVYLGQWVQRTSLITGLVGECLERITLSFSWATIIAWSNDVKKKLTKAGVTAPIVVIGGGIDDSLVFDNNVEKFKRPTLVVVSRLVTYKRVKDVLLAFKKAIKAVPQAQLLVIGTGAEKGALRTFARKFEIERQVVFAGFIPEHQKVLEKVKRSHLLVHASEVEGFGFVVLEALACGVPFVHTDLAVTRELTKSGQGGLFFEVGDTDQAAAQIIKLLKDSSLYNQKVKEAKKLVKSYSWSIVAKQTEKVLKQAVTSARAA